MNKLLVENWERILDVSKNFPIEDDAHGEYVKFMKKNLNKLEFELFCGLREVFRKERDAFLELDFDEYIEHRINNI